MKYNIIFKFLAMLLATVFLLTVISSCIGIAALIATDLYTSTPNTEYEKQLHNERQSLSADLVYAYVSLNLGNIPERCFEEYYGFEWKDLYFRDGYYHYAIYDDSGKMVASTMPDNVPDEEIYEVKLGGIGYRALNEEGTGAYTDDYFDEENNRYVQISYDIQQADNYTVQLYVLDGAYSLDATWQLLQDLHGIRYHLFAILITALLLFVVTIVYLCCSAGRAAGTDAVRPGGFNRLPLDLYTGAIAAILVFLVWLAVRLTDALLEDAIRLYICLLILICSAGSFLCVAAIFSWAAQLKAPDNYWRKNTIIGRILHMIGWIFRKIGAGFRWCFRALYNLMRLLPIIWQGLLAWLVIPVVLLLLAVLFFALFLYNSGWRPFWSFINIILFLGCVLAFILVPVYCAYCCGILVKGLRRMSRGNLDSKISTKYLIGSFRDFALQLNALSDTITLATEQQLRSERMKTELITNVSHDIKTPLTSIINFVDLLEKPHTLAQEKEYLEVLSRQSAQMKKLIEDLMELSKASSGNLSVNLEKIDAAEAINQALGEFSDKLESANLTPVFHPPVDPVYIHADGHHVWRVLFNLLTNAIKYALPGTRLYVDLIQLEDKVVLSLKNVSKAELNISADELMERFVQGDSSRKTEGSGLGLNIAKSLMEVQGGELKLLLDGDLFKVSLIFPAA